MIQTAKQKGVARSGSAGPGRPRAFDEAAALMAALEVFWHKGYEATSLDDLTAAMGLSRSSFYGTFGNKQTLFHRALEQYSKDALSRLRQVGQAAASGAAQAMVEALAVPENNGKGCMMINCITELAPHDEVVADIGRRHLEKIEELLATVMSPQNPDAARDRASAFSAFAIGAVTQRKSGVSAEKIMQSVKQIVSVLSP